MFIKMLVIEVFNVTKTNAGASDQTEVPAHCEALCLFISNPVFWSTDVAHLHTPHQNRRGCISPINMHYIHKKKGMLKH